MLFKRRFCLRWTSIIIAYVCIFLLSYQLGTKQRRIPVEPVLREPVHLTIKRLFNDHLEYLNSSIVLNMIREKLKQPLHFNVNPITNRTSTVVRHGLVVFYDFTYHHVFFQQFLWLYSSWTQLPQQRKNIQNDLIVFISSWDIPEDFRNLQNYTETRDSHNRLKIFPCTKLVDSILNGNYQLLRNFTLNFHMELARLFYWQQTRLSSLLVFLTDDCLEKLGDYDLIFRLDVDSFLMPKFASYQQPSSVLMLGEPIAHDRYTVNRLERIRSYFSSRSNTTIVPQSITISWFGPLRVLRDLTERIALMALWLIKEDFTDSERLHHLTYLNYPSWYLDGILEYASSIVLSLEMNQQIQFDRYSPFDCQHSLTHCLHVSLRDPSHHLRLSKHSLQLLTEINQSNLTSQERYIQRTIVNANGMLRSSFPSFHPK